MKQKSIVMIGPSPNAMGGIATVVNGYMEAGLFIKWDIIYLNSHVEGSKLLKLYIALKTLFRLVVLLVKGKVTLLHVHSAQDISFWRKHMYVLVSLLFKCPVIFHLHGCEFMKFYNERCSRFGRLLVRFTLINSAYVIVLSNQWKTNVLQITNQANVVRIFNSVLIFPDKKDVQERQSHLLLFLGRLGKRKGIYDLLKALAIVKKRFPNIVLKCGGDGELDSVASYAKDLGISDNVEILGWVRGKEKQSLLRQASIYVLPSYNEGLPMAILESMAAGLPVISTTVGGIPDAICSGEEGILIEAGDIEHLVSSIELLLGDESIRAKMGDAARKKINDKFTAKNVLLELENLYLHLGAMPTVVD